MKKSEFQQSLYSMFDQPVDGTSFDERMELIEKRDGQINIRGALCRMAGRYPEDFPAAAGDEDGK